MTRRLRCSQTAHDKNVLGRCTRSEATWSPRFWEVDSKVNAHTQKDDLAVPLLSFSGRSLHEQGKLTGPSFTRWQVFFSILLEGDQFEIKRSFDKPGAGEDGDAE